MECDGSGCGVDVVTLTRDCARPRIFLFACVDVVHLCICVFIAAAVIRMVGIKYLQRSLKRPSLSLSLSRTVPLSLAHSLNLSTSRYCGFCRLLSDKGAGGHHSRLYTRQRTLSLLSSPTEESKNNENRILRRLHSLPNYAFLSLSTHMYTACGPEA